MIQINNDQSISHDGTTTSVDKVPVNEWFHMSFTWNDDNNTLTYISMVFN